MLAAIIAGIFACLFIIYLFIEKKPPNMPPGPSFKVPILGSAALLGKDPLKGVQNFRKK